jgi:hypothetical protein
MNYALDASAMIAFVSAEPGGDLVEQLLGDSNHQCFAHAANLCEVYYDACRADWAWPCFQPDFRSRELRGPIPNRHKPGVWQRAGRLKAEARRISLADCFGLILSATLDAEFVTADRHEMEALIERTRL